MKEYNVKNTNSDDDDSGGRGDDDEEAAGFKHGPADTDKPNHTHTPFLILFAKSTCNSTNTLPLQSASRVQMLPACDWCCSFSHLKTPVFTLLHFLHPLLLLCATSTNLPLSQEKVQKERERENSLSHVTSQEEMYSHDWRGLVQDRFDHSWL